MSLAFSSERERELEKAARVACEFEWNCSKGHYKLPVWFHGLEKALSAYTTKDTPTPDTDPKVKELLEAVREYWDGSGDTDAGDRVSAALRAFDPPKSNPPMPEWFNLSTETRIGIATLLRHLSYLSPLSDQSVMESYNAIRESLAK